VAPGAWDDAAQARAAAVASGRREPVNMVQAAEKGCGNRRLSGGSNAFSFESVARAIAFTLQLQAELAEAARCNAIAAAIIGELVA